MPSKGAPQKIREHCAERFGLEILLQHRGLISLFSHGKVRACLMAGGVKIVREALVKRLDGLFYDLDVRRGYD